MREGLIEYEFLRNAYDVDKDVCLVIARDITTGIGRGPGRPRDNGEKVVTKDPRQLSVSGMDEMKPANHSRLSLIITG